MARRTEIEKFKCVSDNRSTRLDEGLDVSVSRWTSGYRLIGFFENCLDLCVVRHVVASSTIASKVVLKNKFLNGNLVIAFDIYESNCKFNR